ncbi:hypothetical protein ACSQ67_012565 [Phaseolus vulgaris]
MGSSKSVALVLLSINLLFFCMVRSQAEDKNCPDMRICYKLLVPPHLADGSCCPTMAHLSDPDAAACLCAVYKLKHGKTFLPRDDLIDIQFNNCGRKPPHYHCA